MASYMANASLDGGRGYRPTSSRVDGRPVVRLLPSCRGRPTRRQGRVRLPRSSRRGGPAMLFRVLGPLEAEDGAERITIPGERSRALLTALLLQPNTAVPATRLVDALWGDEPPDDPANALHQAVRRLRVQLGPLGEVVRTRASGYLLAVDPRCVDAELFEAGCRAARRLAATDPHQGLAQ